MPEQTKNIFLKLQKARDIIKKSNVKKVGHNDYSNFDYYTPEQVENLVDKACKDTKTICLTSLKADEYGYFQILDFVDLEDPNGQLHFELRTKHGQMKATNEAQQMGGTDTYSERYIKMKVFQIKDNNLDPDSTSGKEEARPKQDNLKATCKVHNVPMIQKWSDKKQKYYWYHRNEEGQMCFGKGYLEKKG